MLYPRRRRADLPAPRGPRPVWGTVRGHAACWGQSLNARQIAVVVAAVQQIVAPALIFNDDNFGGFSPAESLPTPAQPAGYAFAIWGPIYIGCLAYALHQAMPRNRDDPDLARIALPAAALFLGSTAWLWFARHGPLWATVAVIWPMLALALVAMLRLARPSRPLSRATKLAAGWPLAMYAGWLSAASFVNSAAILPTYGFGTAGLGPVGLGVVMVALAGAVAIAVTVASRGALGYAAAVVWALVGIMVANLRGSPTVLWAAIVAAVALLLTLLTVRRLRRVVSA